ncbi:MAG: P1 family peptidase [Burkholderiales bacterium]|nr:P1 family peptidase [Anaerolineae bacterium]
MTRLRDLGVTPGHLPAGPLNAITDVPGVKVGHVTMIEGDGPLVQGIGPIRTGVTAILPHDGNLFQDKVAAAVHVINGFGKSAGLMQVRELGNIETPLLLTNTLNVPLVADGLIAYMLRQNDDIGLTTGTVNPVVGECNDGFLNDIRGRHVRESHVFQAIESAATGPVAEGNVGGGTGTRCYQFKGGIGTASRKVAKGQFTVGALVQSNFGTREELIVLGVPVGEHLRETLLPEPSGGSIIMVLATDAPLSSRQLRRLALRATFGLARTGATCSNSSGDIVIAFSTTRRMTHDRPSGSPVDMVERVHEEAINSFFRGAIEATEEAILNSMTAAETMIGRDGHLVHALPLDTLQELLTKYHRIP